MVDKIVSIGFLSQRDLDLLGNGFRRHFPIADDGKFDDLIENLDLVTQLVEPVNRPAGKS